MADHVKPVSTKEDYPAGQLCPYCAADLALPKIGWYECGNCKKIFYADDTDSDYEDYHARRKESMDTSPEDVKPARVLRMPEKSVKIGATISRATMGKLQAAHDALAELGACPADSVEMPDEAEMPDMEKTLVASGGAVTKCVKMDDGWHVRLPLVVFTNPNDPDLTGLDYFDQDTDFDMEFPGKSTTYFQHGQDNHFGKKRLHPVTLTKDEFAVWADGILHEVDQYENMLIELGKAGKLGMSSGVPGHLVEREPVGKAIHIKYWPLGKDASYTHTPAEPKTRQVVTLKSLIIGNTPQEGAGPLVDTASNIVSVLSQENKAMTPEEIKALVASAVEEYKRTEPATASAGTVTITRDESEQPFKSAGEFFIAVKNAALSPISEDRRLRSLKASGMNEGNPADGGYLVPTEYASGIYSNMLEDGNILPRIDLSPVTGNNMTWNQVDETTRVSTLFGGITTYWLAEAATKTASAPKFKQFSLQLKKIIGLAYATDELLADVAQLNSWLTTNVPAALRFGVEDAIINSDGVGKPTGIITAPGTVSVTRVDASKVALADLLAMYERRLGNGPFVWYVNRTVISQLMQLAGTYQYLWMPPGGVAGSPNSQLLGYPVIETEHCPALGTVGDIILADMKLYKAIDKSGGVESATSIHVKFLTDETTFRFVYRFDGAPFLSSAITPKRGTSLAPFITLSTAS